MTDQTYLAVPIGKYELTTADTLRFAEEAALGMTLPQSPVLTQVAQAIAPEHITTAYVQAVIQRLVDAAKGQRAGHRKDKSRRTLVGLAAPQIGESVRIIVVDTTIDANRKHPGKLECFINPRIVWQSRQTAEGREGCFSAGPVWGLVRRPIAVKMIAYTLDGKLTERIFEDFTARVVQHECDHLEGIRFPERIRTDRKRHWVHAEEIESYIQRIRHWPRLCSIKRWNDYKRYNTEV